MYPSSPDRALPVILGAFMAYQFHAILPSFTVPALCVLWLIADTMKRFKGLV